MPRSALVRPAFFLACASLFFFVAAMPAAVHAQDKIQLFGGYSYMRASVPLGQFGPLGPSIPCPPNCANPPTVTQHANLNGWELAGEYKFLPFLGAVADFSGDYGTLDGAATHVHMFLFGPQLSLPTKVSPFVHALFGVASESQASNVNSIFYSLGSSSSFVTALGAGFDISVVPFISIRLFQVDYLRTHWHGNGQNDFRASTGIVLHF